VDREKETQRGVSVQIGYDTLIPTILQEYLMGKDHIVIVGVGYFEERLISSISSEWPILIIDFNRERIDKLKQNLPDARFIHGDATSRITWSQIHEEEVRTVIIAIEDEATSLEACNIVRSVLSHTTSLFVIHNERRDNGAFQKLGVELIQPIDIALQVIRNRLQRNYSRAINIGLGQGELLEVNILSTSHLVDRKLKFLRPSHWSVAAIYRDNALLVPTGNTMMKVDDRVVLAGNPKVLENVAVILNRGVPQFPLQYGTDVVIPLHSTIDNILSEGKFWLDNTRATKLQFIPFRKRVPTALAEQIKEVDRDFHISKGIDRFSELLDTPPEAGMLLIPGSGIGFRSRLRRIFLKARVPCLMARSSHPYQKILVSMNNHEPIYALETAAEIARLMKIPFEAFRVALPRELRGKEAEEAMSRCQQVVHDFQTIFEQTIPYHEMEGNPVNTSLKFLESERNSLVVTVSRRKESTAPFNRNVPFRLALNTSQSILLIPGVSDNA